MKLIKSIVLASVFTVVSLLTLLMSSEVRAATVTQEDMNNYYRERVEGDTITFPTVVQCISRKSALAVVKIFKLHGTQEQSGYVLSELSKLLDCEVQTDAKIPETDLAKSLSVHEPNELKGVEVQMLATLWLGVAGSETYIVLINQQTLDAVFSNCIMPTVGLSGMGAFNRTRCWSDL